MPTLSFHPWAKRNWITSISIVIHFRSSLRRTYFYTRRHRQTSPPTNPFHNRLTISNNASDMLGVHLHKRWSIFADVGQSRPLNSSEFGVYMLAFTKCQTQKWKKCEFFLISAFYPKNHHRKPLNYWVSISLKHKSAISVLAEAQNAALNSCEKQSN